jgi:hypothetical protein
MYQVSRVACLVSRVAYDGKARCYWELVASRCVVAASGPVPRKERCELGTSFAGAGIPQARDTWLDHPGPAAPPYDEHASSDFHLAAPWAFFRSVAPTFAPRYTNLYM